MTLISSPDDADDTVAWFGFVTEISGFMFGFVTRNNDFMFGFVTNNHVNI